MAETVPASLLSKECWCWRGGLLIYFYRRHNVSFSWPEFTSAFRRHDLVCVNLMPTSRSVQTKRHEALSQEREKQSDKLHLSS